MGRRSRRPPGDQRRARHAPGSDRRTAGRLGAPRRRPASRRTARRGRRDPAVGGAGVVGGAGRHRCAGGRRGERPVARTRRRRRCATRRQGHDRADPAHRSARRQWCGRRVGALDPGPGRQRGDRRARRVDARHRPPGGAHEQCRGAPRHRGRGDDGDRGDDRRHQRRADRPSGDAAERELRRRPRRHRRRPHGRFAVPRPHRAGVGPVEATRSLVAPAHRPEAAAPRRATRRPGQRWCLAPVGLRAVRQRRSDSDRRGGARRTKRSCGHRRMAAAGRAAPRASDAPPSPAVARWRSPRTRRGGS